jgi:hypothetical protein
MKQIFLAFFLFYIFSIFIHNNVHAADAPKKCQSDYRHNQKLTPHHLDLDTLSQLKNMAKTGNPKEGWKLLGENGDEYAAIAYQVLADNEGSGHWYHQLIQKHWINVMGKAKMRANFVSVAEQHFRQYVDIVMSGTLPDSDQILLSYLKTVSDHKLPELTVFDAAWILSGSDKIQTWQNLNHLDEGRTVHDSSVCLHSSSDVARDLIRKDFAF